MPWIAVDLDGTLINESTDPFSGESMGPQAIPGAVEAMHELAMAGHRLTVYTSRFAPMPDSMRIKLKEQITQELASLGFPEMEVWAGTTKPSADIFLGDKNVTFDGDWGLALAQTQTMLEERGLVQIPPDDGSIEPDDAPEMGLQGQEDPSYKQEDYPTQPMPEAVQ